MCLLAMIAISLNNRAQEVMISLISERNPDTVITKYEDVLSEFAHRGDNVIRSQFCFIADGNWNDGSKWNMGEVPPIGSDVVIMADAVIPSGYTAVANEVSIEDGSITVADGGQLRHNTENLVVTMKKSIEPYYEINGIGNYYLLGFPFSENIDVPAIMTAALGNDFYKFDSNSPGAEWRNSKQEAVATVGGTTGYLYANPDAIELSLTGNTYTSYHEETKIVTIPYSEDSTNLFNGWALLGNPYTCNAYIYYYNSDNELVPMDYMVYDTNGELMTLSVEPIAPMQGFFVKVTESTMVYIKNQVYHDYVDLGLPSGILWATCNVGATTPEEYGDYFAWGETHFKGMYDWNTYQYCNGNEHQLTKYCSNSSYGYNGFVDNLTTLLPTDDATTVNWGNDWRMPTKEEWQELFQNTTCIWTTQNEVNGRLFTASNGNSIFLPAAGSYNGSVLYFDGSYGSYWSSSFVYDNPDDAWELRFYLDDFCVLEGIMRYAGSCVRAVRCKNSGINITANPTEGGQVIGGGVYMDRTNCTISATANEGYIFNNWTENEEVISTEATYSFMVNGNRNLVANFVVSGPQYVDLGLPSGLLWATCNVGADTPEDYGNYFAWGETISNNVFDIDTYQHYRCDNDGCGITKYCTDSNFGYNGFTDSLTSLLFEDDVASFNWSTNWRIPTSEEWQELYNNTSSSWTIQNGVYGRLFTALNGNSLFLPAAGFCSYSSLYDAGYYGYYWSSSLCADDPWDAWGLFFGSGYYVSYEMSNRSRYCGLAVRPVHEISSFTVTTSPLADINYIADIEPCPNLVVSVNLFYEGVPVDADIIPEGWTHIATGEYQCSLNQPGTIDEQVWSYSIDGINGLQTFTANSAARSLTPIYPAYWGIYPSNDTDGDITDIVASLAQQNRLTTDLSETTLEIPNLTDSTCWLWIVTKGVATAKTAIFDLNMMCDPVEGKQFVSPMPNANWELYGYKVYVSINPVDPGLSYGSVKLSINL